ncbi:MAG: hypothetical protein ACREIA_13120 [Opitutaceae bacterium]
MHRCTGPVLLALALAASATAVHFYSENRSLRRELAALQETPRHDPPMTRDAAVVSPALPAVPPDAPTAAAAASEAIQPAPPARAEDDEDRERLDRRLRGMERMGLMLTDPEARAATLGRMKTGVDRMYGDLFVRLGLNELQAETLRTLLAERQLAQMESGFLMRSAESDEERAEARAWREEKLAGLDSGVEAILGEDGNETLLEYARSGSQRNAVADVSRRASYHGAPLDQGASDRLVQVMRAAQAEYPVSINNRRGSDDARRVMTPETVESVLAQQTAQNQAILSQSREFLTQSQLEALADKQVEDFENLQSQLNFQLRNPDLAEGSRGMRYGRRPGPPPEG